MPTARIVWNGNPGDVWTNDTDRFKYQLVCDLSHTCGVCLQYHLAVSNWWPIPFHRNCRCRNRPVKPGQSAAPFEDFRTVLAGLDPAQQTAAIGRSNFQLLQAGKVKWEDIVTPTHVRSLKQVVAARKLSVGTMVDSGVSQARARAAYAAVHTPEQELIRQHRRELAARLEGAGLSRDQIKEAVARGIHGKASIGAGPSKSSAMPAPRRPAALPESLKRGFARFATAAPVVSTKPLKPPTFEEAIGTKLEGLSGDTQPGRKARRQVIADLIERHASKPGAPVAVHGMATPEAFRTVRYRGLDLHFVGAAGPTSGIVVTIENVARAAAIPERLARSTKAVYFTGQANKDDALWRAEYKGFNRSLATGGLTGDVVVYNGNAIGIETLSHEMGHNLATAAYGDPSPQGDYLRATRGGEPPVSEYGRNAPMEDFAEAVRMYVTDRAEMEQKFPARFEVIDRLMKDANYGG